MAGCMKLIHGFVSASAKTVLFVVLLTTLLQISHQNTARRIPVIDLQDGQTFVTSGPNRFCYKNSIVPTWRQTWTTIQVKVSSSEVLLVVLAAGEEQLQDLEKFSLWGWFQSLLRERHNETTINISVFSKNTCFKIEPAKGSQYIVKSVRQFDIVRFLVFLAGLLLFYFADSLSRSQVFFYSAGVGTGTIASLIILFFILARILPKKSSFYLVLVGGWSFSIYAIQFVFRNLSIILQEHWHVALGYLGLVGFVSFAVCYRYGPLVDRKSINILSWTLQLFGLLLIYLGIQIQPVAFAIIMSALATKTLEYPISLGAAAWRKIRRFHQKPEPRRLLTEEEYQKQAEEETRRGLEELRKHCSSPEFNPWRTVSRLQSPQRFADFVEGSPHLMPNEVSVHAQEYGFGGMFFEDTDDEDEGSTNFTDDDDTTLPVRSERDLGAGDWCNYLSLRPAA